MARKKKLKEKKQFNPKTNPVLNEFIPDAELDFHLFGKVDPFDIEISLNEFLEDSHISGYSKVLVIVGKGHVVRPIVSRLLAKHNLVENFKTAGYFNGQDGAFEVILSD